MAKVLTHTTDISSCCYILKFYMSLCACFICPIHLLCSCLNQSPYFTLVKGFWKEKHDFILNRHLCGSCLGNYVIQSGLCNYKGQNTTDPMYRLQEGQWGKIHFHSKIKLMSAKKKKKVCIENVWITFPVCSLHLYKGHICMHRQNVGYSQK